MDFRIADTFTDSLARLTGDEQKAVKTTAFDLQIDPSGASMSFHRLEKPRDKRFWSVRVNRNIRLIVHRVEDSLLLCYAGHHDDAYAWAERRKLETHPTTGAAQLVEVRERVEEVVVPVYVETTVPAPPKPLVFAELSEEQLLGYGVPVEWLDAAQTATEDDVLDLADHLPSEAAEALLSLAVGVMPPRPHSVAVNTDPFQHPDAQRRFRTVSSVEQLAMALEYPWEKWSVFLHPDQRDAVERSYSGPARVSGSAGTGKTIVALHRAVFLARAHPGARVLLTTFSEPLANALRTKLRVLLTGEPRLGERIDVHALDAIARRLHQFALGPVNLASREMVSAMLAEAAQGVEGQRFSIRFLFAEWEEVVDAWQLKTWEGYRDVSRLGRKTRLPERQRQLLWAIFERLRPGLDEQGLSTLSDVFSRLATHVVTSGRRPFDFVVVDEAQDLGVAQLRFLAALGADRPDALFFAGDLGQRIFQQPFSWKALGVDIRGRARTLRINYRTSHQIRSQADRLLGPEVTDVDGNVESRRGTMSVFNGPEPVVQAFDTVEGEVAAVGRWLSERAAEGIVPHEIGLFVRSDAELPRARTAVEASGLAFKVLDDTLVGASGHVAVSTMHLAKGLEYRAVVVMACDDEIIPLQERIENVGDDADLDEVYSTERHLLYVSLTRARDNLLVTSVAPASEFLEDLRLQAIHP